jgi:hypothetical protein
MGKHAPGSYGYLREGDKVYIEWDEQTDKVRIVNGDQIIILSYDDAGTVWRMLSYLLVPTGSTGRYT